MGLIGVSDFNDVRRALDATLDATTLPNDVISSPIYQGLAEMDILARWPDAADAVGVEAMQVKIVAILLTAAYIAPAVPMITREQDKDYSYQRQPIDWLDVQARLTQRAEDLLTGLAGDGTDSDGFAGVMFTLAHGGCRGAL